MPLIGTRGAASGRGFGRFGGGSRTTPMTFTAVTSNIDSNWLSANGGGNNFCTGDKIECVYTGSTQTFTSLGYAGTIRVSVVGGGGASQADCGGWCSDSGGGGGGGARADISVSIGSSYSFYVGRGGQRCVVSNGNTCGDVACGSSSGQAYNGERTWFSATNDHYGAGGNGGWWCKSSDNTYTGAGGGYGGTIGTNRVGSNGGMSGYAHSGGGGAQPSAGASSVYGGGGGGGSMDTNSGDNIVTNRQGGQCVTLNGVTAYGGCGEYTGQTYRTTQVGAGGQNGCVPTPNRGGGAGGVASTAYVSYTDPLSGVAYGNSEVPGVSGANGVVFIEFL